ncbi:MAG: polysaccharide deacetylase family protein [Chthoniobacterales bacterium]
MNFKRLPFRHALAFGVALVCFAATVAHADDDKQLLNLADVPKEERNLLPIEITWPAPGEAEICLWKDDKLAAFSYTIDDNNAVNINWWLSEAEKRDIKLTWFLIVDPIGKTNPAMNGNWGDWENVRMAGHAVESHSMTHLIASKDLDSWQGIEWEYKDSQEIIDDNLGEGYKVTTLAYPGGNYPGKNDSSVAAKFYTAARGTVGKPNPPQGVDYLNLNAMSRSNINNENPKAPWSNSENLFDPEKPEYRGWYIIIYHYVKENEPDKVAHVQKDLDYGVEHREQLWIGRFNDIAHYSQSRETATLAVKESSSQRIVLDLTDRMKDSLYTFPLTVKVHLPKNWKTLKAQQDGKDLEAKIIEHEGDKYALVDVVPDKGDAVLTP